MTKLSVEIDAALHTDLQALAARLGRSAERIAVDAIRDHVEHEKATIAALEEGLAAADAGDLVDHEELAAEVRRLRAARAP